MISDNGFSSRDGIHLLYGFIKTVIFAFSFADYDPKKLKNKYAHLTNNSISKHADDFEDQKDDTMWHSDEFEAYLAGLNLKRADGSVIDNPWSDIIQPAIKKIVYKSLESAQDAILQRTSSFELFGYDFMVGEDLSVWLIEINSSPDLSYSTSTTKALVKSMLDDLVSVVVDTEKFGVRSDRPKKKWNECRLRTGKFELLEPLRRRREEKFPKLKNDAQLAVNGAGLKLRRAKRGECPRGLDAEDDPRFSALALLAQAVPLEGEGEIPTSTGEIFASADDDEEAVEGGGESDASSHND